MRDYAIYLRERAAPPSDGSSAQPRRLSPFRVCPDLVGGRRLEELQDPRMKSRRVGGLGEPHQESHDLVEERPGARGSAMPKEPTSPRDEPVARARAWRRDLAGVCSCRIMDVAEGGHVDSGASAGNT
jgi:hypothetical protein